MAKHAVLREAAVCIGYIEALICMCWFVCVGVQVVQLALDDIHRVRPGRGKV